MGMMLMSNSTLSPTPSLRSMVVYWRVERMAVMSKQR